MTTAATVRVLLVDDHRLVRAGLAAVLGASDGITVVGEAADGAEAVAVARRVEPDAVVMDLSMPGTDGVTATRRLLAERPGTRVLVLTSATDPARVRAALHAGATGYLLKGSTPDEIVAAVRSMVALGSPIDPRVARFLLVGPAPATALSPREEQVLRLVAEGLPNKQIGRTLGITERTVKVHLGNVFRRIGVRDRRSAASWAGRNLPREPA